MEKHENIIICDLNCRVGKAENDKKIGIYGEGTRNNTSDR